MAVLPTFDMPRIYGIARSALSRGQYVAQARLQEQLTELVVTFYEVPHPIFEIPATSRTANELVIRLQPDECITLTILAKNPGEGMRLKPASLGLDLGDTFKTRSLVRMGDC